MNEEELKAKLQEIEEREGQLKEREEALTKREADARQIGETIKAEYEKRLEALKAEYEKRLAARDEVIKQLAAGEEQTPASPSFMERMNERRERQNKKW